MQTPYTDNVEAIRDKIVKEFKPEKIILFGSRAWGTPRPDSDIDLFIVKESENTRATASAIDVAFFPRTFSMDLLVYTPKQLNARKKDLFIKKILKKGKKLYG